MRSRNGTMLLDETLYRPQITENAGFRRERTCFQDVFHAFFAISYLKSVNYMLIRLFQPDDKKFYQILDSKANDSQKSVYS